MKMNPELKTTSTCVFNSQPTCLHFGTSASCHATLATRNSRLRFQTRLKSSQTPEQNQNGWVFLQLVTLGKRCDEHHLAFYHFTAKRNQINRNIKNCHIQGYPPFKDSCPGKCTIIISTQALFPAFNTRTVTAKLSSYSVQHDLGQRIK